jgi:hypothetical protein
MQFCGKLYCFCKFLFSFDLNYNPLCVVRKKSKQRIFLSRLLLIIFAAGQVIGYSHQHRTNVASITNKAAHQSSQQHISEKCQLCDAMHHNQVVLSSQVYAQTTPANFQFFTAACYDFVSISLIHSHGRAPPVS